MNLSNEAFVPELRELERSILYQLHAAIHQKDVRNSDRLLIFSHLIDRYIEMRGKIVMNITEQMGRGVAE